VKKKKNLLLVKMPEKLKGVKFKQQTNLLIRKRKEQKK